MSDPLVQLLAELPSAEPDAARADRIRTRCRARLARPLPATSVWRALARRGVTAQLWQPLIGILGVAYLAEVVVQVLRVYSLR